MNNKVQVSLAFTADTQQARAQVESLQRQLNNLSTSTSLNRAGMPITKELLEAQNAATRLKTALEGAVNVNTGKLDLSKFNQNLKESGQNLNYYSAQLRKLGPDGEQAFKTMTNAIIRSDAQLRRTSGALDKFFDGLKRTAGWQLQSTMIHGFTGAITEAFTHAEKLNKSLNNIRIVTGKSVNEMKDFTREANRAAKALSTSTTEYTNASLIYYQQGLSEKDVKARTDITIKAANAAGVATEEMADYLTAVWNSYGVAGNELEKYVDVMAAVGAATATSLEEISTSMEKVASVGAAVGIEFEQMSAVIATVSSVTRQSAESIGTSYKTIFARMGDLKLGKTDEDGIGLGQVSSQLKQVGVDILDETGNLRDMGVVLDELMSKWEGMNKATQQAVAIAVAGKRNYTNLLALMNNQDMYRSTLGTAEGAEGALDQQAAIYAESWAAAEKRVKASAESIYQSLINDEFMIDMLDTTSHLLDAIGGVTKGLGGMSGVLTTLGMIATKVFQGQIAQSVDNFVFNIKSALGMTRKEAEALRQQTMDVRQQFFRDKGGLSGNVAANLYGQQDKMQAVLLEKTKNLTQEQQRYAQSILDTADNYNQMAQNATQAFDNTKREYDRQNRQAAILLKNQKLDIPNLTADEGLKRAQKIGTQGARLEGIKSEIWDSAAMPTKNTQAQIEYLKTQLNSVSEAAKLSGQNLQQYLGAHGAKIFKQINAELEKTNPNLETIAEGFERMGTESEKNLREADFLIDQVCASLEALGTPFAGELANNIRRTFEELRDGAETSDSAVRKSTIGFKAMGEQMDKLIAKGATVGQSLTSLANTMMSVATLISSIKSLGSIWDNEDLSTGEKFASTLMSISMLLTAISGIMKADNWANIATLGLKLISIDKIEIKNLKQKVALKAQEYKNRLKNAGAKQAENAVPESGGTPTAGGGWKNTAKGVGAMMVIAAAIWGSAKLFGMGSDKLNKEENELKEAAQISSELSEAAQTAAQHYNNLGNSLDNLNSSYNNIKNLTVGTQEWKDAIFETNNELLKLLETNDMLSSENYYTDDNGVMHLAEGVEDKLRENARADQIAANLASRSAKSNQRNKEFELEKEKAAESAALVAEEVQAGAMAVAGAAGGAKLGATVGSYIPFIGNVVGGIAGAALGAGAGWLAGATLADLTQTANKTSAQTLGELYAQHGEEIFSNPELTARLDENTKALLEETKSNQELKNSIVELGTIINSNKQGKRDEAEHFLEQMYGIGGVKPLKEWYEATKAEKDSIIDKFSEEYEGFQTQAYGEWEKKSAKEIAAGAGYEFVSEDKNAITVYDPVSGNNIVRSKQGLIDSAVANDAITYFSDTSHAPKVNNGGGGKTIETVSYATKGTDVAKNLIRLIGSQENAKFEGWEHALITGIGKAVFEDQQAGVPEEEIIKTLKSDKTKNKYITTGITKSGLDSKQAQTALDNINHKDSDVGKGFSTIYEAFIKELEGNKWAFASSEGDNIMVSSTGYRSTSGGDVEKNNLEDAIAEVKDEGYQLKDWVWTNKEKTEGKYNTTVTNRDNYTWNMDEVVKSGENILPYTMSALQGTTSNVNKQIVDQLGFSLVSGWRDYHWGDVTAEEVANFGKAIGGENARDLLEKFGGAAGGIEALTGFNFEVGSYEEFLDLAEAFNIEVDESAGLWAKLQKQMNGNEGKKTENTVKGLQSNIETLKSTIDTLNGVVAKFNKEGRLDISNAVSFVETYKDLLTTMGYDTEEFLKRLVMGDVSHTELNKILFEELEKKLKTIFSVDNLGNVDTELLAKTLGDLGVSNADEIVATLQKQDKAISLTTDSMSAYIEEHEEAKKVDSDSNIAKNLIAGMDAAAEATGLTREQIFALQTQELAYSLQDLNTDEKTAKVLAYAAAAKAAGIELASLAAYEALFNDDGEFVYSKGKSYLNNAGWEEITGDEIDSLSKDKKEEIENSLGEGWEESNKTTDGSQTSIWYDPVTGKYYFNTESASGVQAARQAVKDLGNSIKLPNINFKNEGSGSAPDPLDIDEEIEKYAELNRLLADNAKAQQYASDKVANAYGNDKLVGMRTYIDYLKEQNNLLAQQNAKADEYLEKNKNNIFGALKDEQGNMIKDTAGNELALEYDEFGKIKKEKLQQWLFDNYLGYINTEEGRQWYEDLMKWTDEVNSDIELKQNNLVQMAQQRSQIQAQELEALNKYFEYENKKLTLREQAIQTEMDMLDENSLGDLIKRTQLEAKQLGIYQEMLAKSQEEYDAALLSDITDEAKMQKLDALIEKQKETLLKLDEWEKGYSDTYQELMSNWEEDINREKDIISSLQSSLTTINNIRKMVNKGTDYEADLKYLNAAAGAQKRLYYVAWDTYKAKANELEVHQKLYDEAKLAGNNAKMREELEIIEQLKTEATNAYGDMLSAGEAYGEALKEVLTTKFEEIGKAFEEALTGGEGFEQFEKELSHLEGLQEKVLTETNKIYETNKLMREAEIELGKTQNKMAQQRLNAFIKETAQLQEQSKVSNFELEVQQAKYDLLLAQIALEEAQNAKNQVRLTRDSRGNFGYVYTADQSEIAKATQEVEDAENKLYNVLLEGTNDFKKEMFEIAQAFNDEIKAIGEDYNEGLISQEEAEERLANARSRAIEQMKLVESDYALATELLGDKWKEAWVSNLEDSELSVESFKDASKEAINDIEDAIDDFEDNASDELSDLADDFGTVNGSIITVASTIRSTLIPAIKEMGQILDTYSLDAFINSGNQKTNIQQGLEDAEKTINTKLKTAQEFYGENGQDWGNALVAMAKAELTPENAQVQEAIYERNKKKKELISEGLVWKMEWDAELMQALLNEGWTIQQVKKAILSYDTGGYTGSWGSEGRLALLHQKELVLNENDTANLLASMEVLDKIIKTIDLRAANAQLGGMNLTPGIPVRGTSSVAQDVHIEAHFPDVTSADEIQLALDNLVNEAYQHASIKRD